MTTTSARAAEWRPARAVGGDDLVRPRVGPRPPIPHLTQPRPGLLTGMLAPPLSVDQPGRRVPVGTGLRGRNLGRLQRRRHHQQSMALPRQHGLRRSQRGGLACAGRALHGHQLAVTGQGADDGGLSKTARGRLRSRSCPCRLASQPRPAPTWPRRRVSELHRRVLL